MSAKENKKKQRAERMEVNYEVINFLHFLLIFSAVVEHFFIDVFSLLFTFL